MAQKNFIVKTGISVNGTEVIDSNAQIDWARLKNAVDATNSVAGNMSASDKNKLDGIENNATADQTASEIRTLVASATDSNVFTDAKSTKLDGIATSANNYSLPIASAGTLGGIKIGSGISIDGSGVISATTGTIPFYKADGSSDTIALSSSSEIPFYVTNGSADNIALV